MGGGFAGRFSASGGICSNGGGAPPQAGSDCVSGASGAEVCFDPAEPNCGSLNGESFCADSVPPNDCLGVGGGLLCGQSAPTPPVPDNGTPGVAATPDEQITVVGSAPDVDYYDGDSVAGSTSSSEGGSGSGSGGSGIGGDAGGDTGSEGDGEGEEFLMSVYFLTGTLGAGKTLAGVSMISKRFRRGGARCYKFG